jgi:hypothetical protein
MHPGDIPKTAIATLFRLFEFLRMTFGLRNAGNTFQRLMDRILAGLDFVFVYLDDVIIGSRSMSEHLQHVRILFQRLQAAGLVINCEKCVFGVPEVDFLGHHISAAGVSPIASRVTAINDHPRPTTVKELQGFLGVINFYRRFIPAAAHILKPLTDQLKGRPKPAASIPWTEAMQAAFAAAKAALASVPRLLIPVANRQKVFNAFHNLAHAGTRATRCLIAARAIWRGINSDVAAWVRDCQACCRGKVTAQPAAPVQPIAVPAKRFSHVHLDLVGPLPVAANGSTYLLTMVDRTTRWLEAARCAPWRRRLAQMPSLLPGSPGMECLPP